MGERKIGWYQQGVVTYIQEDSSPSYYSEKTIQERNRTFLLTRSDYAAIIKVEILLNSSLLQFWEVLRVLVLCHLKPLRGVRMLGMEYMKKIEELLGEVKKQEKEAIGEAAEAIARSLTDVWYGAFLPGRRSVPVNAIISFLGQHCLQVREFWDLITLSVCPGFYFSFPGREKENCRRRLNGEGIGCPGMEPG